MTYRMPIPSLPTWQDCHEMWSKRRRRQLRENTTTQEGTHANTTAPAQPSTQSQQPISNAIGFKYQ